MRVDLIRHGQVPGNLESRYVGSTDEALTEAGREAAEKMHPEQPQIIYVSPMLRCRQTADILYPGVEQVVIPELRECDFGAFEYKNYKELDGDPDYQAWIDSGGTIGFPGGESREEYCIRTAAGFRSAMADAKARRVEHAAIVAHGGTIMAILNEYGEPGGEYFRWQAKNLQGYSFIIINNIIQKLEKI